MAALAPVLRHILRHKAAVMCLEAPRSNSKAPEAPDNSRQLYREPVGKTIVCLFISFSISQKSKNNEAASANGRNKRSMLSVTNASAKMYGALCLRLAAK